MVVDEACEVVSLKRFSIISATQTACISSLQLLLLPGPTGSVQSTWLNQALTVHAVWSAGGTTHRADPFRKDNRMGIEGTLHRISAMRDRHGSVNGLTYRIGRHVKGTNSLACCTQSKDSHEMQMTPAFEQLCLKQSFLEPSSGPECALP